MAHSRRRRDERQESRKVERVLHHPTAPRLYTNHRLHQTTFYTNHRLHHTTVYTAPTTASTKQRFTPTTVYTKPRLHQPPFIYITARFTPTTVCTKPRFTPTTLDTTVYWLSMRRFHVNCGWCKPWLGVNGGWCKPWFGVNGAWCKRGLVYMVVGGGGLV